LARPIHHSSLTDEDLLHAYRDDGDKEWLGHLLQRYTTLLLGVTLKYLKNKSLAEDAVQQVFLKALTHLTAEEIKNFKGWLYILTRNHCLQQLRDNIPMADEATLAHIPATEEDKEEIRWREHTLQQINDAIELLNEEQRRSIHLFYLKMYSYEQIIAETGYTFMQVKSFIQNGKRNLKTILLKKTGNLRS
jgi:RNA polymerase sigma factor (sigma-70 family)